MTAGPTTIVFNAYIRWLYTQGERSALSAPIDHLDGWLIRVEELHSCRAPGATCLRALRDGKPGSPEDRINDSKGCGGVMRIAPAGLVDDTDPFQLGADIAALTLSDAAAPPPGAGRAGAVEGELLDASGMAAERRSGYFAMCPSISARRPSGTSSAGG